MDISVRERKTEILNRLAAEGKVRVSELSEAFGVSEVTIRADLADLEKSSMLARVHGGAISSYKTYYSMGLTERLSANTPEKTAIAEWIATQIENDDTVIMNAGTTTLLTLRALARDLSVTIVTNSVPIATEAGSNPSFNVVLLGGQMNSKYQFTYGDDTINQLCRYHADKLILSVDGITDSELTTYHHQEAELNRRMIERAGAVIVAADYTKIGRAALSAIAGVADADCIVTNRSAPKSEIAYLTDSGVRVILV